MKDIFHQNSFAEINSEHSKLRTYAKLKTEIGIEKYLSITENIIERTAITKIRLSNHDLMIEKGRHHKLPPHERFCLFCKNKIETEQHFMLECNTFENPREQLCSEIRRINPIFNHLNESETFVLLLNGPETIKLVGNYLSRTLNIRRFLLEKHKENV